MKSTVVGFDWIASDGSLKLLEINTDVSMTGYSRPEYNFDFDALAQYCSDQSLTEVKLHHSNNAYYGMDWKSNTIKAVSDEVFSKLSSSLATHDISASIYLDSNAYLSGVDEIDSGTTLDLRVCANVNSKLDYHAVNKENLLINSFLFIYYEFKMILIIATISTISIVLSMLVSLAYISYGEIIISFIIKLIIFIISTISTTSLLLLSPKLGKSFFVI